jgi:enoyl-CoA hydratase
MPAIHTTRRGETLVLTLENPPAQALSRRLIAELDATLGELESRPPRALVVIGAGERFFSAGLDLLELHELERPALEPVIGGLESALLRLFRLPLPVVAAVNGHAIAGGAILALAADRRLIARGEHLFGLNEVQVGLPLPGALFEIVKAAVGARDASGALLEGRNHSVEEALAIGLAHEAVEPAALLERALGAAEKLGRIPRRAYARMKELLHAEAEARIEGWRRDDPFLDIWFEKETREAMAAARARLLAKRAGREARSGQ